MVPPPNDPLWKKLVTGERELRPAKVTLNLFLFNNRLSYSQDGSSANLHSLIQKTHQFFSRYESTFREELKLLAS